MGLTVFMPVILMHSFLLLTSPLEFEETAMGSCFSKAQVLNVVEILA